MLVTAVDIADSVNDAGSLTTMLERAEAETGVRTPLTLADAGYHAGRQLAAREQRGQRMVMPDRWGRVKNPYHKNRFVYDEASDSYRCPNGERLSFVRPAVNGARVGDGVLDLPLPLAREVGRAENEHPAEAGHVGGGSRDEGLARAHLAHDGGAAVDVERKGGGADGVRLRPQRGAQQLREGPSVPGGPVAGRVGLHHPLGDGVAIGVDELGEVHFLSPSCGE